MQCVARRFRISASPGKFARIQASNPHDGWTSQEAKAEAKRYGLKPWQRGMKDYIKDCYKTPDSACQPTKTMTDRIKWTDRRFDFTFPVALYPEMIERLRGTPARLEDRISSLPAESLRRRDGERWSIQENAGHLLDLESLVMERLNQYDIFPG